MSLIHFINVKNNDVNDRYADKIFEICECFDEIVFLNSFNNISIDNGEHICVNK